MDWNFKASWDFTELEPATLPNIGTVNASTTYGVAGTENEFSVDLKLGQVGNSGSESLQKWKEAGVLKMGSSPSGSSKRARAVNNGTQAVYCLVDGCNSDLSRCRDYHRRHKVCEIHSKTPQVIIGGHKQRFCQQCSRFHSLEEFDEGKRSCRKRLDGHNRRRRKPQPEPITRAGTFLSSYQGSQLLPLATSHVYPSTSMVSPSWTGVVTSETEARLQNQHQPLQHLADKQNLFMRSSVTSYKENKQYTFLQEQNPSLSSQCSSTALHASPSHSIIRTNMNLSESGDQDGRNIFCHGITSQAHESHRALSLLSSPQTQTPAGHGLNPPVQPDTISLVLPLGLSLHDHDFESVDSVMVATGGGSNLHGTGLYNMGSDESQSHEAPQPFPFTWD